MISKTGHRYKDVLFALATAYSHGQSLGKLQLQKLVYLTDTLSLLWEIVSPKTFQTYKQGPYDFGIQNAVDVLAFRGAVNIVRSNVHEGAETISATYEISEIGLQIIKHLIVEAVFARKYDLSQIIGRHINRRGWHNLKKLVYSEATYLTMKAHGLGRPLETDSILTNDSLQILMGFKDLVRDKSATGLSRTSLVSIFFQILDDYQVFKKPN
jgi:uncharacterized protein YwgA